MSNNIADYERQEKMGEGTYGAVYKAIYKPKAMAVALKVMPLNQDEEGISAKTIREIATLRHINHPSIVKLINVIIQPENIILIFPFLDFDLRQLIHRSKGPLKTELQRSYAFQLLTGIYHLHVNRVIHRDLKPENILLDCAGYLKICDFGLSRLFTIPLNQFTNDLVTMSYRPPEMLLHNSFYDLSIDVWSAGCVLAEMAIGEPLFPGDSEIDQIHKNFSSSWFT